MNIRTLLPAAAIVLVIVLAVQAGIAVQKDAAKPRPYSESPRTCE